ncbi:hypothetical protein HBH84_110960 [Parastagonospora nodorum]|nr:hypothetical protein HBH84_110960 [Parastagonospora nodorum]
MSAVRGLVSFTELARGVSEGSDAMSVSSGGSEEHEDRWLCCGCFEKHDVGIANDVGARSWWCGHAQCSNCWEYSRVANWVIGIPGGGLIGDGDEEMEEEAEEEEEEEEEDEEEEEEEEEGEEREAEAEVGENALP